MTPNGDRAFDIRRVWALLWLLVSSAPSRVLLSAFALSFVLDIPSRAGPPWRDFAEALCAALLALLLYWLLVRVLERRTVSELDPSSAFPQLLLGILLGLVVTVPHLVQVFTSTAVVSSSSQIPAFVGAALLAGASEEVFFRGILLRLLEARAGTLLALLISATCFALLHERAILFDTFVAGLGLGACFIVTRRLWLSIAGHFAHNALLSILSSGKMKRFEAPPDGLLRALAFESIGILVVVVLLFLARKRGQLRPPRFYPFRYEKAPAESNSAS